MRQVSIRCKLLWGGSLLMVLSIITVTAMYLLNQGKKEVLIEKTNPKMILEIPKSRLESEKFSETELASMSQNLFEIKTIPQVYVESEEEVKYQYYYDLSELKIKNGAAMSYFSGGEIKARGNTSYDAGVAYGPIPYKLKLKEAVDLLGMGASKKWVLIPTFLDRSYLRQIIGFNVGQLMMSDNHFVPEAKIVEVYANNAYKGVYLLAESIEEDENRLEIKTKIEADEQSFPFLLEIEMSSPEHDKCDSLTRGEDWFTIDQRVKVRENHCNRVSFDLKFPKTFSDITGVQGDYIVARITELYAAAEAGVELEELGIDVQSFVDYFIFQEIFANDGFGHSSTYLYENKDGLLTMGPIWDFDMFMSKVESTGFNLPMYYDNVLFRYLMKNEDFAQKMKIRLLEVKNIIMPLVKQGVEKLRSNSALKVAIQRDQARYPSWGRKFPDLAAYQNDNIVALTSFDAHIDYVLGWMWDGMDIYRWWSDQQNVYYMGRLDWLEQNLEGWAEAELKK